MKGLLLPNAVNQKDEKQHTAGLNDTAIPHVKIKITETPLEKKVNTAVPEAPMSPLWLFSYLLLPRYWIIFFNIQRRDQYS